MNVLVVGGNGFLGRNVVRAHLAKSDSVTSVYHANTTHLAPETTNVPVSDLCTLDDDFDRIYLTSAFIPHGRMDQPDSRLTEANVDLPKAIASRFSRSRLIFASSVAVYGTQIGSLDEASAFKQPSMYGLSKIAGEYIVRSHPSHAIVRFSSLYGRGMNSTTFLPRIIESARRNGEIILFGDGLRRQDYLHVTDAVRYMMAAGDHDSCGTFLGVYGTSLSNANIAKLVADLIPGTSVRSEGSDNSPSFEYCNSETLSALGVRPQVVPAEGIADLVVETR